MRRRLWGVVVIFCLMVSIFPVKALAAGEPEQAPPACQEGCSLAAGHEGECLLHETRYQTAENGEWHYGTLSEACANVSAGGTVEVLRNITPANAVTVSKPLILTSADPENPCKITYTTENRGEYLLTVSANALLADIILDGGREQGLSTHAELVGVKRGQLFMESGAVIQNNDNVDTAEGAGGLRVIGGQAVMQAGSAIRSCRAVAGGGAAVVGNGAMLGMNGGVIEYCEAFLGGGVYIRDTAQGSTSNPSRVILQNGSSIRCNQAKEEMAGMTYGISSAQPGCGGGVYIYKGAVAINPESNCTCSVADNTAENSGGGIFANAGLINLLGGTVSGNQAGRFGGGILTSPYTSVRLGYGPSVNGNIGGNRYFDNLYLDGHVEPPGVDGEQVPGEGTDITQPMAIGFGLQEGVSIGVSRWVRPDAAHTYRVVAVPANRHNIDENDLSRFFSDDPAYIVLLHGGNIVLTHADVVFDTQGHGVTPPGQPFGNDHKVADPGDLSEKGYTFGGWYQEPQCINAWDFDNSTITVDREEPLVLYAKWELIPYAINYQLDGGNNAAANPGGYTIESDTIILQQPTKAGYTFLGWTWTGEDTPQTEVTIPAGSIDDREYTAHWQKRKTSHSGSGRPKPQPTEEKLPYVPPALASEEHFAYIMGYPDGNVRPEANISRAEVAAIFFRLMTDDFRAENAAVTNPFSDVTPGSWYNNAVSTAARAGLIRGLPDGTFAGERPITRAEFAAIAARFLSDEDAPESGFADMAGHWAEDEVSRAVAAGWIKGFPDGGFHPGEYISRAEVVTMVNRMLGRTPNAAGMHEDMAVWPDNLPAAWYYTDVQEATNGHTYERDGESAPETWTGLTANRDWAELEH